MCHQPGTRYAIEHSDLLCYSFTMNLVDIACGFVGVKAGDPRVKLFQKEAGGPSYCMGFVQYCVKQTGLKSALYPSGSALTVWDRTLPHLHQPAAGLVAIWEWGSTWKGHCGIVTAVGVDTFTTVEANTSPGPGIAREGDGVYLKTRHTHPVPGTMRLLGFIQPLVPETAPA